MIDKAGLLYGVARPYFFCPTVFGIITDRKLLHSKLNLAKTGREPEHIVGKMLSNPIKFKLKSSNGLNILIPVACGYKAYILIDICNAVILARDSGMNILDKIYFEAKTIIAKY